MQIFKKIIKWPLLILTGLIVLVIIAGLLQKLFSPSYEPNGTLIDVGGFSLNLDCKGQPNGLPTLIMESGLGAPSQGYHWLHLKLRENLRVCRYDRAGLGFSEPGDSGKDAETVSQELHTLLAKANIEPPYLIAGASLGGLYIRVFTDLYPDEVVGLIFLDSSHPEQIERMNMPEQETPLIIKLAAVGADLGIVRLFMMAMGDEPEEDLPSEQQAIADSFYNNGKQFRAMSSEIDAIRQILDRAKLTTDFGDRPILVFTAGEEDGHTKEEALELGNDPQQMREEWFKMQLELAELSSNGKQFIMDGGGHSTIMTREKQADFVIAEIRKLLQTL